MISQFSRATGRFRPKYVLALVVVAVLAGCSRDASAPEGSIAGLRADATTTIASLTVIPAPDTIAVGGTKQLKATAYTSTGTIVSATFSWLSYHPAIATVSATGLVKGVAVGTTAIVASSGGHNSYAMVTVTAASTGTPASVAVTPASVSTAVGTKVQLSATVKDAQGQILAGQRVSWASSQPAIARVDSTGLVSALAAGSAAVSATAGTVKGQATVTVTSGTTTATTTTGSVVVNASSRLQRITGWAASAQAGQGTAAYPYYRDRLLTLAAGDLGINRLRVPLRSGAENPVDYWTEQKNGKISQSKWGCERYTVVNDDSNPGHINPAGFHFSELDSTIEQLVLPFRAKQAALGRRLYVNLEYTAFLTSCGDGSAVHRNPQEYAEFALAAFQHLKQKYGLVPDAWEMILEPDNNTPFTGNPTLIGKALVATAARLSAAGFHPAYIAPSTSQAANAPTYFDAISSVSGAGGLVAELAYHRYGVPPSSATLSAIAQRAVNHGIRSSMLEHIGADYNELIADLRHARVSAWQQFTLAFTGADNGGKYYVVNASNPTAPTVRLGDRTRYLRQFFHYVLAGATRLGASTSQSGLTPLAFQNANGKMVVVVRAGGAAAFTVSGLPAGTYGATYTTAGATGATAGSDQTVGAGQVVKGSIPAAGVITVFQR